jgi:holo-[acyl-carrier protein] synthase
VPARVEVDAASRILTSLQAVRAPIVGVGVDAVEIDRFRQILSRRPGFAARYFSPAELSDAAGGADPTESLAARFAAKEAVMKALGTGIGGFALRDVEVCRQEAEGPSRGLSSAPSLVLHGGAAALAARLHATTLHLSLTHTSEVAVAFVVAEGSQPCSPS